MSTTRCWLIVFVVAAGLSACRKSSPQAAPTAAVTRTEADEAAARQKTPGDRKKVAEIVFEIEVAPEDRQDVADDVSPYVNLEKPEADIARMRARDEVVLPTRRAVVVIDYPLREPVEVPVVAENPAGFTRAEAARSISRAYQRLYVEEEQTATQKTIPMEQREGLINRNRTDGIYGIWGHDLGDLDLHTIEVFEAPDGTTYLALGVDS